jgi:hypothetical protein
MFTDSFTMRINYKAYLFISLLLVIFISECGDSPTESPKPTPEENSWTVYTPYEWTHDGKPYQATYCTIYSDAASEEMKQQLGEIANESFNRILTVFDFDSISDFIYPPGYSKIEIYLNRNHTENINWAYWGGFIITIRSSEISGHWLDYSVYTSTHELTHVFDFLIEGREALGSEVWFKEGIAVHIGCTESSAFKTIENLNELESWISENQDIPGEGNPIGIHQIEDFPSGANWTRYYQFFELAMRYLLDQNGLGKSHRDVLNVFYDLRQEVSFADAFENRFGISVDGYEAEFYDRMRIYLQ